MRCVRRCVFIMIIFFFISRPISVSHYTSYLSALDSWLSNKSFSPVEKARSTLARSLCDPEIRAAFFSTWITLWQSSFTSALALRVTPYLLPHFVLLSLSLRYAAKKMKSKIKSYGAYSHIVSARVRPSISADHYGLALIAVHFSSYLFISRLHDIFSSVTRTET